ncbi:MAG: hypothetical protein JRM82_00190, partial [Nitrososphaerota archaeon]|nr:hypothetical protein [Nitrososphaerota archaeon]
KLSFGRYGPDNPGERKVSLEITVDKWVSDALGKIRSKKSVSNLVNSLLATVIRQFDPGPASPFVYELVGLLAKHRQEAEASGDTETLASVTQLHSMLEPYIDLAEAELTSVGRLAATEGQGRYYSRYAVPVLHCGTPMAFLRGSRAWKCLMCGFLLHDNQPGSHDAAAVLQMKA